jgi:hypothetical protein
MDIKIYLEDVCLDLLLVRKHVYSTLVQLYNRNHLFKAADHIHVGVRICTVHIRERVHEKELPSFFCCLYIKNGRKVQLGPGKQRQKLGLVWRIRKKISQIIKDYFYLPFFLLIILCISPFRDKFF